MYMLQNKTYSKTKKKSFPNTTHQDVQTETIDVAGTKFVYRKLGENTGVPVIYLNHLGANLDNHDPRIVDGIAAKHQVITFDNRGVGASEGSTPDSIAAMAQDAIAFIRALGFEKVDLIGFSLGGFIVQEILLQEPQLVRKVILAGTGPAGGTGIDKVTIITFIDMLRSFLTFRDPKFYLFFTQTANGRNSARLFLDRLKERQENRDKPIKLKPFWTQLKAIHAWGLQTPADLSVIKQPVLVANGESDRMVPSSNSVDLARRLPNSELILYKDAGHGGVFQYHEEFVKKALEFLEP
jgi:pimeloyl-ACP methyl ester carboxylesterase